MNFVAVDYGSFVGQKDCYCCCQRTLEHTDTHYINQNYIPKYCVEASIPVLAIPEPNPEGVKLLEAEDNHIDKSKLRIFNKLPRNSLDLADRMCGTNCYEQEGYVCMYHKSESQYHCHRPWNPWTTWENDSYAYESGIASLSLSILSLTLKFLL